MVTQGGEEVVDQKDKIKKEESEMDNVSKGFCNLSPDGAQESVDRCKWDEVDHFKM